MPFWFYVAVGLLVLWLVVDGVLVRRRLARIRRERRDVAWHVVDQDEFGGEWRWPR